MVFLISYYGSDKVSTLFTPGFSYPSTYLESIMFLNAASVVNDHINQNTVLVIQHYLFGNIYGYYFHL